MGIISWKIGAGAGLVLIGMVTGTETKKGVMKNFAITRVYRRCRTVGVNLCLNILVIRKITTIRIPLCQDTFQTASNHLPAQRFSISTIFCLLVQNGDQVFQGCNFRGF